MENDNGRIYYGTGLDNSQLRVEAAEARNILQGIGTSAEQEGDRIDEAMKKIGASVAGVFAVSKVKDFITQVANVRGEFQQLDAAFKVLTGDAGVAENLMSQLIHTAATTPFGVTDISNAARQLLAYGVEADKVNETLIRLGDICAGLSIPIGDLAYLYGTTMTQGRLYTADLNQFLGRGIPLADELAKQFGVAKEEIKKMVEEGKVGFPEVQQAIINLTNEGGKFGGLMEAQSKTITGQLSNLQDGFEQMFNEIGKSTEGVISESISLASTLVEHWREVGEALLAVITTYGAYKAAVLATAAVQNTVKTVRHTEEAAQLYAVMTAEQKAKISKLNLAKTSEAYYTAVKAEITAEMERQTQLAVTTQAELNAARERLTAAEAAKAAAAENVAAKRAELEAVIQEAASEQAASAQKRIAIESEAQSRAALRVQKSQEQKDAAIAQARALKEAQASNEIVAAKNREIAAINEKLVAARAEEVQHSRNIVAIRKEMAATVDETTSKKIAKAQTALETAEENLNTASKARNTAARQVSSKAALLDSTVRRANTVETVANTAAQSANATATGVLSVAKTRLTAVAARLNAVIMDNPWALALAGVVALGYGIYKLVTYQTDAEKAQQRLNDATNEMNKSVASERVQIDALFARLQAAKKGTNEYEAAKKAIIDQYGKYLEGLSSEVRSLEDVAAAYNAVKDAAIAAAKARALEKSTQEAADTYAETEAEQKDKLYEFLKKQYGNRKNKQGMSLVEDYYAQLVPILEGRQGVKVKENFAKKFDRTHYIAGDPMTGIGSYTYTTNELKEILGEAAKARKIYNDTMQEAERRFGTAPETKQTNDETKEVVKNKAYWEKYLKEQQGLLDAMTAAELKTKKAAEIRKNIANAQSHIDSYSVSKQTRSGARTQRDVERVEDQTAERTQKIDDYKNAVIAANAEAELEIRQRQIDNMDDGYEKQKEQIKLNYDRLIAENKKREQEMIDALADAKVLEWQNEHPKATKAETIAYRASLNLTVADLTPEQRGQLEEYQRLADESRVRSNKEALSAMLQDSLTYEQRRAQIAEEYQKKIEALYEHDDKGERLKDENGNDKLKDGVSQGNVDELNYQQEQALEAVDEQFAQREETYKAWCNEIANLTLEQLMAILEQAEAELDKAKKDGADGQQLATARAKVTTAKNKVAEAKAKENLNPDKRSIKEWEDLYKTLNECEKQFEDIGKTIGGVAGEIIQAAGEITSSALSMINGIMQLTQATTTSIGGAATAASKAIQTVEKASVILTIVTAAMQIATKIVSLFNDDDEKQEEIEALQDRIDQLQWELDNAEVIQLQNNSFNAIDKLKEVISETTDEVIELYTASNKFNNAFFNKLVAMRHQSEINEKSVEKLVKAYANVSYTANKFIGEGNTQYDQAGKQLENYAQQMILIQQQIDTERDKKDPNNGQIQEWEQKIQELGAEMEELVNSLVEDIMGGSYSEIAEELSDAFFEAFQNGEDYAEAWGDKVNEIVADIMRRMVVQRWIEPLIGGVFDKYKDKWFPNGQFAGMQSVMDSLGGLEADLTQVGEQWIDIWNSLPESVKEMMNTATEETREASSKSGINASQESVDELNGRATAIQGHTYSISENTKLLVATSNRILESVLNIEVNTDGLSARMETVESHVKEVRDTINDIALKGIKIK